MKIIPFNDDCLAKILAPPVPADPRPHCTTCAQELPAGPATRNGDDTEFKSLTMGICPTCHQYVLIVDRAYERRALRVLRIRRAAVWVGRDRE